jgi:hypothetical protein
MMVESVAPHVVVRLWFHWVFPWVSLESLAGVPRVVLLSQVYFFAFSRLSRFLFSDLWLPVWGW